ncbi:ROK family protein [Phaeacidiphilus oryzae]|uniref:ROK family protein n=1 Tax=Phaeacidiphilus oryzae TaxID=348818 RepID=UPI00055D3709|nr:ROK family protein [Phaeacidiphilus oryzae]
MLAGVDIGGTTTQVVLCDPELNVLERIGTPTPAAAGGPAMLRAVQDALGALLHRRAQSRARSGSPRPERLLAVGVGAAGVVDPVAGRVLVASDSFDSTWSGFPVAAELTAAMGVPAFLDNDVNAFLRGEATRGAAAGEPDVLGMTLGTGVGGALWVGGELYEGPHAAAGEIGHLPGFGELPCTCGGRGHLETLASGRSLAARYAERTGRRVGAEEVATAAEGGDREARAVLAAAGRGIARAVLITAGLLDITTVVIGGGVARAWHLLHPEIAAALADEPPVSGHPVRLLRSSLGEDAVAVGAAARARAELAAARRLPDSGTG